MEKLNEMPSSTVVKMGGVSLCDIIKKINEIIDYINNKEAESVPKTGIF